MKFHGMMIDTETLGFAPNAVVLQVGVTLFRPSMQVFEVGAATTRTFGWYIDLEDQLKRGSRIEPGTLFFWTVENSELWKRHADGIKSRGVTVAEFKAQFKALWSQYMEQADHEVWANGVGFDVPKIEHLLDYQHPWLYNSVRDYRTLKREHPQVAKPSDEGLTKHDALHDSLFQTQHLLKIIAETAHVR
jgi:hypothetical protein